MLIVNAGMKRSGTTWMFNVARVALDQAGTEFTSGHDVLYHDWKPGQTLLIKTHWWHEGLARAADVVLSSERDVEHMCASLGRLHGRQPSGPEIAKVVEHYRRWDAVATFRMTYRDMTDRPASTAAGIVEALSLTDQVDPRAVLTEVETLRPPDDGQDPVTMLLANHRAQS